MGQGDSGRDDPINPLSDSLDRDIMQRRQRIAELGSLQKDHEREFGELKAQYDLVRSAIGKSRDQLIATSRERTTLISELDHLLQRKIHRDNVALQQQAAEATEVHAEADAEMAGVGVPPTGTPTGTSEWTGPTSAPPAVRPSGPHAGPPPTAPALYGPRAPTPPQALDPAPEGDGVTQVTARPSGMRSAAFHAPARLVPVAAAPAPQTASLAKPPPRPKRPPPLPAPQGEPQAPQVAMAVEVDFGGDTNLFVGFSENISEGGVFMATYAPRKVGERFPIKFTLPGHHRAIACEVEVSWVVTPATLDDASRGTVPGMGLRFLDLAATDRDTLTRFISQREPLFFPV